MACPSGGVASRGAMPAQSSGRFNSIISSAPQAPPIVLSPAQQLNSLPPAQRAMMLQRIQQQQAAVARPATPAATASATPAANPSAATTAPAPVVPVARTAALVAPVSAVSPEEADRKELDGLRRRAEEKQGSAQFSLALRYLQGRGVEKDAAQARQWLEAAVAAGYTRAADKLAELDALNPPPAK